MISQHGRGTGHKNLPLCMVLYLSRTFLEFFPFKFQYVIYDCKYSRFKKRNLCGIRTNYTIIGDIYHSYTHVNTGPTVKSSVLIRIHPKCNVHHNQRNHDVVVIILLAYWFISLLPVFCMSLMNSWSLPLGYKGMNGVINSCRFRLLY